MLILTLPSTNMEAMNEINAAKHLRAAAAETAEARKVWIGLRIEMFGAFRPGPGP
jgi:hypothetical protein